MFTTDTRHSEPNATAAETATLSSVVALDGRDDGLLLGVAASLAGTLNPSLGAAIVKAALDRNIDIPTAERLRHFDDQGTVANVDAREVVVGRAPLFHRLSLAVDRLGDGPQRLERRGETVLFVAIDGKTAGLVGIAPAPVASSAHFPTSTEGLAPIRPVETIELADGDEFELRIAPVTKVIGGAHLRLLAYNGSVPGPTLRVQQGSQIIVNVVNEGDLETTVHWHGLRLENRYDGTHATQRPIPVGGTFTYRLSFPDPGVYWYHPHVREDYGQELGLYGNIVVIPSEADHWSPAHRELALTLDDILVEDGHVAPFNRLHPTFTAMGRFGNVMLVNGETQLSLDARLGEVVRLYLTNTANTRVFNVGLRGAQLKLVGGDSGRYEREQLVDTVILAPSERAVVDVLFDRTGEATLEHRTPGHTYRLGTFTVTPEPARPSLAQSFATLRVDTSLAGLRDRLLDYRSAQPHKTLALVAEMDMAHGQVAEGAAVQYVCPMHPDVVRSEPSRCPKCFMKLLPSNVVSAASHHDNEQPLGMAPHSSRTRAIVSKLFGFARRIAHGDATGVHDRPSAAMSGIEWEDDMVDVNRITNPTNTRWKLIDRQTGAEGSNIDWRFRVGQQVKIRIINEMDSDHPMHHPFHIHGAGRFVVLSRNGVADHNLVWKDTVLVRTGETVDILLDVTHSGIWMAHCHIAEHHGSGMMLHFRVDR